jgi:putative polyhydroxyalkanoate system protein
MSYIDMHARHSMSREDAQAAADQLASDLARKFERPGVNGTIMVREREIRIEARLGLMLMFLKPQIENEITRYLRDHFGCTFV